MKKAFKISASIITLNEENNIADCLQSLDFVDEIVIIDSLSTDKTKEIALAMGAKVIDQKFLGHVKQKQLAVEHCSHDWVLCLDADERVTAELKTSILQTLQGEPKYKGYQISRISFHLGRWIKHGGWYPDRGIRLFNKTAGSWKGVDPHDRIEIEGEAGRLQGDLEHYVFTNLHHNVATNNTYSTISGDILFEKGKRPSLLKLLLKPPVKFFECYIIKGGILDGMAGFIIAVGAAYSIFLKFAKLWELHMKQKLLKKKNK